MARLEPVLVSSSGKCNHVMSPRKCHVNKLASAVRAEDDCNEAKVTLSGVTDLHLGKSTACSSGDEHEQQLQEATEVKVMIHHPPTPVFIPRPPYPSLSSSSSAAAAAGGGRKVSSSSLPALHRKAAVTPPRATSAVEAAPPAADVILRPPPRLVKSVQPPPTSAERPCSCLCHVTALHSTLTPPTTATLTLREPGGGGKRVAATQSETQQDQGQGQRLCWRCKMHQCSSCGLDIPNHTLYKQPVCRSGRLGAPWRHVRGVTTSSGIYYSFLDGAVKSDDARYYPPYGYIPERQVQQMRRPVCLCGGCKTCVCARRVLTGTSYYDHAKTGFRYWFDDQHPKPKCKNAFKSMGAMAVGYKLGY